MSAYSTRCLAAPETDRSQPRPAPREGLSLGAVCTRRKRMCLAAAGADFPPQLLPARTVWRTEFLSIFFTRSPRCNVDVSDMVTGDHLAQFYTSVRWFHRQAEIRCVFSADTPRSVRVETFGVEVSSTEVSPDDVSTDLGRAFGFFSTGLTARSSTNREGLLARR